MKVPRFEVPDQVSAATLAKKTPAEKITWVKEANKMARMLSAAGGRFQLPDCTDEQAQQ